MRFNYFSELMKNASAMIGNSSAGVREAPFLGLPSLDVGTRQNNRGQSSYLNSCSAFDAVAIERFVSQFWFQRFPMDPGFGGGDAAMRFSLILQNPAIWKQPAQKVFAS
jgi:UDP-N-acetylglucosamine 2-epimerase (hydrolysing)